MSSRYSLGHKVVKVEGKTREDLLTALANLGTTDADFSGDNGIEYLWEEASKFDSNCEYCLDLVKDKETDEEVISEFIKLWIERDGYYKEHDLEVIYDENGKAEFISLAYQC